MLKILLVGGHESKENGDSGAKSPITNYSERTYINEFLLEFNNREGVIIDYYPFERNLYIDIKNDNVPIDLSIYDYVFEIHFNWYLDSRVNGMELITEGIEKTIYSAVEKVFETQGFTIRPRKTYNFQNPIYFRDNFPKTSFVYLETCFITNLNDLEKFEKQKTFLADNIMRVVVDDYKTKNPIEYPIEYPYVAPLTNDEIQKLREIIEDYQRGLM